MIIMIGYHMRYFSFHKPYITGLTELENSLQRSVLETPPFYYHITNQTGSDFKRSQTAFSGHTSDKSQKNGLQPPFCIGNY